MRGILGPGSQLGHRNVMPCDGTEEGCLVIVCKWELASVFRRTGLPCCSLCVGGRKADSLSLR